MTIVWSYGGGTQSAAIAVLILEGKLPHPDIICMANTSREVTETWEYLERFVRPSGLDVQIVGHEYATVDLYAHNGDLLLPVFSRQNGSLGKMPTYCSNEWKQRVVRRWLHEQGIDDCDVWLGISIDEAHRMKHSGLNWYRHVYPLIEILPTSRHQCISIVEYYGWATPPKSRCWMCPNMSNLAWQDLKLNYPADFERAVELENEIRRTDQDVYFHRLGIPLIEAVEQTELQPSFDFDGCDSGYCWT